MENKEELFGYLFVYFAGERYDNGEQIHMAISTDGMNWDDLNNNNPILLSHLGEGGVRDPYILRSHDEEKFYLIATDLKIYGNGDWNRAQLEGSKCIIVWESVDLVNWSQARRVKIASDSAGCAWAPEATYDIKTGKYVVYWASRTAEDNYEKQRVYCATTEDFIGFSEPIIYIERENDIIDTAMIEHKGNYYRYSKDETTKNIRTDVTNSVIGGIVEPITAEYLEAQEQVEGPAIFKFNNEEKWCLLIDNYTGIGYYPIISTDLSSGNFYKPSDSYRMPSRARHGSVVAITKQEYDTLVDKWMDK